MLSKPGPVGALTLYTAEMVKVVPAGPDLGDTTMEVMLADPPLTTGQISKSWQR